MPGEAVPSTKRPDCGSSMPWKKSRRSLRGALPCLAGPHGRGLPSESTVRRFLASNGYDARSLKARWLASGLTKAFEAPTPNDLWMVDFARGPT